MHILFTYGTEFLDFVHSVTLKNTTFWKLDLFLPSGERVGHIYSVGSVRLGDYVSMNVWTLQLQIWIHTLIQGVLPTI
jgi:hypothetical protein